MEQYGNYLGILKWSLAQNDGTKPSEVKPLSEEVFSFLFWLMYRIEHFLKKQLKPLVNQMLVRWRSY